MKPAIPTAPSRDRRIYIAGPMTGIPEWNFPAFNAKAAELRAEGWHVENPADHGAQDGVEWADYLRYDLTRIATCEAIYLLPGWERSKGAQLEVHIAKALGMQMLGEPVAASGAMSDEQIDGIAREALGGEFIGNWDEKVGRPFARAILAAASGAKAETQEPVLRVVSWTNGSYHRNYKLEWLRDVPKGTLLYASPSPVAAEGAKPAVPKWIDDPHDIEQGQMLNPEWLKLHGLTARDVAMGAKPAVQGVGFSPMYLAPIDGTAVLLYLPTTNEKFAVGQWHGDAWGDDEGNYYVHEPKGWMSLDVLARIATAAPLPAQVHPAPEGFALVPLRMTKAMRDVTDSEGWQWEDLLAAAESITEEQYEAIAQVQPAEQVGAVYLREALECAAEWISNSPHGDNCYVSEHYEGDPGDRCNCGKESIEGHMNHVLTLAPLATPAPQQPVSAEVGKLEFYRGVIAALGALASWSKSGDTLHDEIVKSVGKKALYQAAEPCDVEWAGLDADYYAALSTPAQQAEPGKGEA